MDSKVKIFVFVNITILIGLILYMRTRRTKAVSKFKVLSPKTTKMASNQKISIDIEPPPVQLKTDSSANEKNLNVIFTWNGHDWDAYEVLGLPAGSSMDEVIKAYDEALASVDVQSQEFIHRAYQSICQMTQ